MAVKRTIIVIEHDTGYCVGPDPNQSLIDWINSKLKGSDMRAEGVVELPPNSKLIREDK